MTHINRIMYLPYLVLEFFCHIFKALNGRNILYRKIFYLQWVNSGLDPFSSENALAVSIDPTSRSCSRRNLFEGLVHDINRLIDFI